MSRLFSVLFVVFCCSFSALAQDQPDLGILNFLAYSTMTQADGKRLVSVSFRVVNFGTAPAGRSVTRVTIGPGTADFGTPKLAPGQVAYISHSLRTNAAGVDIDVTADVNQQVAESNENNNHVHYAAQLQNVENSRWQSIGPTKITTSSGAVEGVGRVTTLAVHATNPNVVYVGARASGLWKTSDGGETWTPMTDALPHPRVDAVALDPAQPQRVLIASPDGVFESTSGGSVWTQLTSRNLQPTGLDGAVFLVQNTTPVIESTARRSGEVAAATVAGTGPLQPVAALYLPSNLGLFVSQDGGHNWTLVLGEGNQFHLTPIGSLQFSTTDAGHLYASLSAFSSNLGIYEGENGGYNAASWHQLQGCSTAPLPVIPASSRVWVAESHGQIWMSFLSGLVDGNVRQLWKTNSTTCTLNGHREHEWVQVPISPDCDKLPKDNSSFLYLHPNDPSVVFKAGRVLCRSGSGDTPVKLGGVHDDQHSIATVASAPGVMYLGNDGGIYRSDDVGASWRFVGEGLGVTELLDLNLAVTAPPLIMVAGGWDNGAYTSTPDSPVWNYLDPTGDATSVAYDRTNPSIIYEVEIGIRNFNRFQGGTVSGIADPAILPDCQTGTEGGPQRFGEIVAPGSTPPVVAACQGMWAGPPWQQLNAPGGNNFSRVRLGPGGMWLAGTTDGRVFGGTDVTSLNLLFTASPASEISALTFLSAGVYYAATRSGRLYLLDCQNLAPGQNCVAQDVSSGLPAGEITAIAVDPLAGNSILVAVSNIGIFRGAHPVFIMARTVGIGGISPGQWQWRLYSNGLPAGITVMDMETAASGQIVAATWGRGAFWLHSGPLPGSPQSVSGHITSYEAETIDVPGRVGRPNQIYVAVELDSRPGWVFSGANLPAVTRYRLQQAFEKHRLVSISYVQTDATNGRITGVK
jgi:hypothetical protein